MKNQLCTLLLIVLISISSFAQEEKGEIVKDQEQKVVLVQDTINSELIKPVQTQKIIFACRVQGIPIESIKKGTLYKIYEFTEQDENWNTTRDIYNTIRAKVPGVQITKTALAQNPRIRIRGDENIIIIIDGNRYTNTSILNTLDPNSIAEIKVTTSIAAANNLRINRN